MHVTAQVARRCLFLLFNVMAILAAAASCASPAAAKPDSRPSFVLCMADDQGWGDVGYSGNELIQTPELDEMAAACLRLDRFYSAAPVCSPTRGSVLTGRHPNRFACFSWGHTLRPQELTVAEALQAVGYATGHFGKWHLGSVRKGAPNSPGESGFDDWLSSPNFYENDPLLSKNGEVIKAEGESSAVAMEAALAFIRRAVDDEKPFLAVIWFGSPHTPHIAAAEEKGLYEGQPEKMANYHGEITGIDRAMGSLRRELRELGAADNTVVWYTSDNGAAAPGSTGGLRGKKGTLYEGGIRVPAIIEWPATIKSPRTSAIPCGTVDIFPTLLALAGVKAAGKARPLDGLSLQPLIEGRAKAREKPLGFWVYPEGGRPVKSGQILQELAAAQQAGKEDSLADEMARPATPDREYSATELPGHAAWIDGDYKLHKIPNNSGGAAISLYNLRDDPKESNDLSEREPARTEMMAAELEAWQKSVVGSLNGEDY